MRIYDIDKPDKIKNLSIQELEDLAQDIRTLMIHTVSGNGGHLGKNLSVVELTIACHSVFDMAKDKLIFDGGDACYTHKMLTGRSTRFSNLRKLDGLSDTQKRAESLYDVYEATLFSACSAALGFCISRDLLKEDYEVLAYFDRDSLKNGKTLEALYDIGMQQRNMILIYNEHESQTHTSFIDLTTIRSSDLYQNFKSNIRKMSSDTVKSTIRKVRDGIKDSMLDDPLFKGFNLDYMGPVNGHDIKAMIQALKACRNHTGPIVLHVITKNGYGYEPALNNHDYDSVDAFNENTGEKLLKISKNEATFHQIMDTALWDLKTMEPNLVKIETIPYAKTIFEKDYIYMPNAYRHAISTACGIALGNGIPFVSIPSKEINDSFHAICMEMARMKCPVIVGIQDCGLINQDKEHGIYDISVLSSIPNLVIAQPKNDKEVQHLLYSAIMMKKPVCIRMPYGLTHYMRLDQFERIEEGTWELFKVGDNPMAIIISYGLDVERIIQKAKENEYSIYVVNARFIKPLDFDMIDDIMEMNLPIYIYENDSTIGGLKTLINDYIHNEIAGIGIRDHFVKEGPIRSVRIDEGIHLEALFRKLENENTSR
ncbi:MAG: 1-deoxy-D-xylulose-5-phosphate synthase [Holdemanella sp.]|nr:1-deoxy-D-xylulose-5-phosphate synthase [Holdemanella sp.]